LKPNKPNISLLDYSVSKESFSLIYNPDLELYATSPVPSIHDLPAYYKSDDYISHTDSNHSLFDKLYQQIKKHTLRSKLKLIDSYKVQNRNLLDIGCGTGDFLYTAQRKGWNIVGVEPNEKASALAQNKLGTDVSIFENLNDLLKNQTLQSFDVITLWHVLEHVPNYDEYISSIKKMLHPDGILIIAVPNYNAYDANYYGKFWAAYDVPRHLWHFSQNSMKIIFSQYELKVMHTKPMYFDSFYVSLLSEKYKNTKSHFIKAFWIGLVSNFKAIGNNEYSSLIYVIKNTK